MFVVTGRREDVDAARREIISAAEHFSHIRASRSTVGNTGSRNHNHIGSHCNSRSETDDNVLVARNRRSPSPASATGNKNGGAGSDGNVKNDRNSVIHQLVTIGVRVPMNMVGLVVGPKGATVKRIQQDTGTYIVTPGRQKDPVFELIGSHDGVEKAKHQIEAYLETRLASSSAVTSPCSAFSAECQSQNPASATNERVDSLSSSPMSSDFTTSSSSVDGGHSKSINGVQSSPPPHCDPDIVDKVGNSDGVFTAGHHETLLKEDKMQFILSKCLLAADSLNCSKNGFKSTSFPY